MLIYQLDREYSMQAIYNRYNHHSTTVQNDVKIVHNYNVKDYDIAHS